MEQKDYLLEVDNLVKYFPIKTGFFKRTTGYVKAVDGISFKIERGKTMGLVGESGCGKSTCGRTILRLLEKTSGDVRIDGKDIFSLSREELRRFRPKVQIVFQDPYSSLQRQRICIARALALNPEFIVCDEPVSALDVSIQAQVINLLKELQKDFGLTYLFISHDLSVVEHISDTVGVMYLGTMVEFSDTDKIFAKPLHPYTQALFSAIPIPDPDVKINRIVLEGSIPSPANPPSGCKFHTRCAKCMEICKTQVPEYREVEPNHFCACHLYDAANEG